MIIVNKKCSDFHPGTLSVMLSDGLLFLSAPQFPSTNEEVGSRHYTKQHVCQSVLSMTRNLYLFYLPDQYCSVPSIKKILQIASQYPTCKIVVRDVQTN